MTNRELITSKQNPLFSNFQTLSHINSSTIGSSHRQIVKKKSKDLKI